MNQEQSLSTLEAFCQTYELGNFTKASKALRITPAAVSRAVARLEEALGVQLFRRSTRTLEATQKGHRYYAGAREALRLLQTAAESMHDEEGRGRVRISVPTTYGLHRFMQHLRGFPEAFPNIELEIHVSNQNIDFVREGYDFSVRMGPRKESGLIARTLGAFPLVTFASPKYLKRRAAPKSIEALRQHTCIGFALPRTGKLLPWLFANPDRDLQPETRLCVTEDPNAGVALALAGEGIFQMYAFMVERELQDGTLVPLLREHAGRTRTFSLLYPVSRTRSRAARKLIEHVLRNARP
jgi:DNA-binding transcriptional LysR family regulator